MTVLAIEPNPAHTETIRHIVCHLVRAKLTLVHSTDDALRSLQADIPDLILLPPLVSPDDEAKLLAHLRTLPDSAHVETLMTPLWRAPDDLATTSLPGWRPWRVRGKSRPRTAASERRLFAEQLTSSLMRAREARQRHAAQSQAAQSQSEGGDCGELEANQTVEFGDKGTELLTTVVPDASVGGGHEQGPPMAACSDAPVRDLVDQLESDRRVHQRFAVSDLQGLRVARIKCGPQVRLVDLSSGGALLESAAPLQPESEAVLELLGDTLDSAVPFRVVRSQASVLDGRVFYRGACAFSQPLALAYLLQAHPGEEAPSTLDHLGRFDIALKAIVDRYVSRTDGEASLLPSLGANQVAELVASLREVSRLRPSDPVAPAINDLLAVVISALQQGGKSAVDFTLIEEQLRGALPWVTARFAAAPGSRPEADTEILYFQVPAAGGHAPRVLNVELPQGSTLEDWEFRLLKATAWLAALLGAIPDVDALQTASA